MIPSECSFNQSMHSDSIRLCPANRKDFDVCPDTCPLVALELRCKENWASMDTMRGEIADLKTDRDKIFTQVNSFIKGIAHQGVMEEIKNLNDAVDESDEDYDALRERVESLEAGIVELTRTVLKLNAAREIDIVLLKEGEEKC